MVFNLALLALASRFLGPHVSFLAAYVPAVTLHFLLNKWWFFAANGETGAGKSLNTPAWPQPIFAIKLHAYTLALRFVSSNTLLANLPRFASSHGDWLRLVSTACFPARQAFS